MQRESIALILWYVIEGEICPLLSIGQFFCLSKHLIFRFNFWSLTVKNTSHFIPKQTAIVNLSPIFWPKHLVKQSPGKILMKLTLSPSLAINRSNYPQLLATLFPVSGRIMLNLYHILVELHPHFDQSALTKLFRFFLEGWGLGRALLEVGSNLPIQNQISAF